MARPIPPINGDILYRTRMDRGWTQLQVAQKTREAGRFINDSSVARYENGKLRGFLPGVRKVFCDVLGLTPEELFAPCEKCGKPWSATCREHEDAGDGDDKEAEAA